MNAEALKGRTLVEVLEPTRLYGLAGQVAAHAHPDLLGDAAALQQAGRAILSRHRVTAASYSAKKRRVQLAISAPGGAYTLHLPERAVRELKAA